MDIREHWERIYRSKSPTAVGWYEPDPATSLAFIGAVALRPDAAIVDVGGGASLLIDRLLDSGFTNLTVVDVSVQALAAAQGRLDARAKAVQWVDADVRHLRLPHPVDIWHDRGVFHFLTDPDDKRAYVRSLLATLRPGGHAVIATYALDGPQKCSGLAVARYSPTALAEALGERFELLRSAQHTHVTPVGVHQSFTYGLFRRMGE